MPTKVEEYQEKYNFLPIRMRVLLCFVAIVLFYLILELFWYSTTSQQIQTVQTNIDSSKNQITELIAIQESLNSNVSMQRNNPKTQKILVLEKQIASITRSLREKTANLVPPNEMASVLKAIIDSSKSLKLQSLTKQNSVELSQQTSKGKTADNEDGGIKLYRHSVEIVLQGSYLSTYEFLEKLESMERKVAFDSFNYSVDQYPNAEVKLVVSTLSLDRAWIGG